MVALTPLLRTPPRFSESEPEPPPCDSPARVCESWRDTALYPFFLADGELFVHPCADLDEWYASACKHAATPDCHLAPAVGGVDAAEERPTIGREDNVPRRAPALSSGPLAEPYPCGLLLTLDDVASCWFWGIPACGDDLVDCDDAESSFGMTWSSDSAESSGCLMADDELEHNFTMADAPTCAPVADLPLDQTALEPLVIMWLGGKSPSDAPDPELEEYGSLIQSILCAGVASDRPL